MPFFKWKGSNSVRVKSDVVPEADQHVKETRLFGFICPEIASRKKDTGSTDAGKYSKVRGATRTQVWEISSGSQLSRRSGI